MDFAFSFPAMKALWGEGQHQAELEDLKKQSDAMKSTKILSICELMKEPSLRWQLYMLVLIVSTVQLCGINAVESVLRTSLLFRQK